jgi:high-affinity iron transporter
LAGLCALAACSADHQRTASATDTTQIRVTANSCAPNWSAQRAGKEHFTVTNASRDTTRVTFIDAESGGIYGQVWQLGPGTSQPLDFVVPAGTYRWRCVPIAGRASVSASAKVKGSGGRGVKPLVPLSSEEINDAMAQYHDAVSGGISKLVTATDQLQKAVRSGDLSLARTRWLTAHMAYERLGAAYGTFGDLDGEINGRADGLPNGVHDKDFTGFLRIEYGLYHGESAHSLRPITDALDTAVHKLAAQFPKLQIVPSDIPLRAHEILENTLQFELTGDTDEGSHTNLATARANVDGTSMVLGVLTQQLRQRDPKLYSQAETGLHTLAALLDSYLRNGRWTPLSTLSRTQREQLDAVIGQLLEQLALIPNILQMPPSTAPT